MSDIRRLGNLGPMSAEPTLPTTESKRFPVLGARDDVERGHDYPISVSWSFVQPFSAQAESNHGQTLRGLAGRGGLSPSELWCIAHGMGLREGCKACGGNRAAIEWLKNESAGAEWRMR